MLLCSLWFKSSDLWVVSTGWWFLQICVTPTFFPHQLMLTRSQRAPFCSSSLMIIYYNYYFYELFIYIFFLLLLNTWSVSLSLTECDATADCVSGHSPAPAGPAGLWRGGRREEGSRRRVAVWGTRYHCCTTSISFTEFVCQPGLVYLLKATDSLK